MNRLSVLVGTAAVAVASAANADIVANIGTVTQTNPRPSIVYSGAFGAFVSSYADATGPRTVTSFDLSGIAQYYGGNLALVEVRVRDTGANTYGSYSPGADIDLIRITGTDISSGTVSMGYQGTVGQHLNETEGVLKSRVAGCDAVSGDQHFNSQHFISLGLNGMAWMHFADFTQREGTLAGGPGGYSGGGSGARGGLLIQSGMKLDISEAGTGESYAVDLVFEQAAVPAPGAVALFAGAGLLRRRRR